MTQKAASEKSKDAPQPAIDAASTAFYQLTSRNAVGLDAWMKSTDIMMSAANSMSQEIIDFADKRLKAMWDTTQSMAQCNTWSEAYELQSSHTRSAVEQYIAEANKLMSLTADASKSGWSPIQDSVRSALEQESKQKS